ncbi:MAG: hypothetical protein D8M59_07735 [Planctomycetes bacterium]|nr:hypothetical protein [Planctomycetota bacterium]
MVLCRDTSGQKWVGKFLPRVRAVAGLGSGVSYGFGDDLSQLQMVFEETAAAFEQRRARWSW